MTWAVTFDFHNTIAQCDEWFTLEVYDLIPTYLALATNGTGEPVSPDLAALGKRHYRELRLRVLESGVEVDAAQSVIDVLAQLGMAAHGQNVERLLCEIFRPTVASATPMTGVLESVRALHGAGVPLAVVSSAAYHPFLEWTLEKFGIADCFRAILTSAATGYYKSTSRIYSTALQTLDVAADRCIHIGDSERFDVEPARSLGIRTVLVGLDAEETAADLRVDTLVGLPELLESEFGLTCEV